MPKMGDAMEEGTLLKWLKSEGEEVSEGDAIAEIETDKVTMELEAEDAGTLAQLIADEGQDVPVGGAIAFIQGEGEEVPERSEGGGEAEEEAAEGGEEDGGGAQATTTETEAPEEEETEEAATQEADGRADGHFRASPIVRRLAEENDLDLAKIDGSGPAGRIVERDVRAAMESGTARRTEDGQEDGVAAPEQPQAEQAEMQGFQPARLPEPTEEPGTQLVEPTRMMQVIGERMTEAQQHIPHFYATVEVRMDAAMALRKQLNEQLEEEGIKLSVNDFVMKACAVALRSYPNLNALYTTRGVELHEKVDMAMAVALDQGLITPVIRDIGSKGLVAISNIARRPDYDENGEVVPASMMKLTLSADHRIANGRDGALYMAEVKRVLENPVMLMV